MRHCRRTGSSSFPKPRADGILDKVVVDIDTAIVHISRESWQKAVCVGDCYSKFALGKHIGVCILHPLFKVSQGGVRYLRDYREIVKVL